MTNDESQKSRSQEVQEVEAGLRSAIADDIELVNGDRVLVQDYVLVAKVFDDDGGYSTRITQSDGSTISDIIGWLEYARIKFDQSLRDNIRRAREE